MTTPTVAVPFIELEFAPNLKLVPHVREFASSFYREVLGDDDAVSRIAVATHELLENAVRNASDQVTKVRLEFEPVARRIQVRTVNRLTDENLRELKQRIDEINAAPDPDAHYLSLLRRSAKRTDGSGLGLGRVYAEAGFSLRYHIDRDWVIIIAEALLPKA